jgi:type I restriction enzyme S subunit
MGEATEVIGGGTPSTLDPENFKGSIPWITPADMTGYSAKTISGGSRFISELGLEGSGARWLPEGSVLFSSRAPIGYVAIASKPVTTNQGFKSFVPIADLSSEYLYYWLISAKRYAEALASGTTFLELSGSKAALIPLPVAPAAEQIRIVEKLEELLSGLDAGVAELKAAQKKLAQYRQSLLKAAVEGTDTGRAFPKVMLGNLVATIGQGWSPKCEHEAASNIEQWAVMKTTAIQPLAFDGSHNKVLPKGLKPREHLELKSGDLLVTRAGPRNRVGVTCLVRTTRERLILCDKAYRIRCDETKIDPSFLELVLNAPHMVQRIDELKTGISDSGLNLTQDRFFTLEIPLPALEVQRAVIDKIHHQVELIQNQENSIEISLKQSTAQRQNILKAAFSGQLVPQDPSDEPASELLERIRAERAAQQAVKKPRGRKAKEAA